MSDQWTSLVIILLINKYCFYTLKSQKQPPEVSYKKGVLKNFAKFIGKHLCQSLFFNKVAGLWNFIKNETLAQVFSSEFCEIFMNTFFTGHLWTIACEKTNDQNAH